MTSSQAEAVLLERRGAVSILTLNRPDTLNAMMALPNLIALLLLSPVVFRLTREHFEKQKALGVE